MSVGASEVDLDGGLDDLPVRPKATVTQGDRAFKTLTTAAASVSLIIVSMTLIFLVKGAWPALSSRGPYKFFSDSIWNPSLGRFGVFGLLVGTVIIATIAMVVAVPSALAMALFINEYAPARVRSVLTSVIDLLAALPSILFAIWGFFAFKNKLLPVARWISTHLGVIPFFRLTQPHVTLVESSFTAGVVVGIMILPIITSVSRDVMAQVPRDHCEGALALGGTRWGMIRDVILPFGKVGIVGAALLGFGRALGETIAVALLISMVFKANPHVLQLGAGSVAAHIATRFGEATSLERSGLVGAGLALFLLTFAVNFLARRIVRQAAHLR